ncbi:hypothetical protein BX265_3305 [Streptomyces sp. TLI_235]|nr:hypothetical protein BX265_3305 [Streptomyces sp. TLI_235]
MKISQKIRDEHGDGSTAVESGYDTEALAGMAEKSAEFAAQGNRVYLQLADRRPREPRCPGRWRGLPGAALRQGTSVHVGVTARRWVARSAVSTPTM